MPRTDVINHSTCINLTVNSSKSKPPPKAIKRIHKDETPRTWSSSSNPITHPNKTSDTKRSKSNTPLSANSHQNQRHNHAPSVALLQSRFQKPSENTKLHVQAL